jgi:hypothetical protein
LLQPYDVQQVGKPALHRPGGAGQLSAQLHLCVQSGYAALARIDDKTDNSMMLIVSIAAFLKEACALVTNDLPKGKSLFFSATSVI